MEALALLMVMQGATDRGITECCFYLDSLQLVQLLVGPQVPISVVWRAHRKVLLVWDILGNCQGFNCVFTNRKENVLTINSLSCKLGQDWYLVSSRVSPFLFSRIIGCNGCNLSIY